MAYLFIKAIDNSLFMSFPGGTCLDGVNDFICRCRENYIGKTCGIIMDPCHGITCLNGGRCDISVSFRGECACPSSFTGKRCESSMQVCESMPCGNGGSCVVNENKYSCVCLKGYYGDRCEYSSFICTLNSCQNGGICKQHKNRTSCICPSEFVGDRCESSVIQLEENFSGAFSPNSCVSFHPHSLFTLFLIFLNLLIPTWHFVSDTMLPVTNMPIMFFIRCSGNVPDIFGAFAVHFIPFWMHRLYMYFRRLERAHYARLEVKNDVLGRAVCRFVIQTMQLNYLSSPPKKSTASLSVRYVFRMWMLCVYIMYSMTYNRARAVRILKQFSKVDRFLLIFLVLSVYIHVNCNIFVYMYIVIFSLFYTLYEFWISWYLYLMIKINAINFVSL